MDEVKKTIERAAEFIDRVAGVADLQGVVYAATNDKLVNEQMSDFAEFARNNERKAVINDRVLIKIYRDENVHSILFVEGTDVVAYNYAELLAGWCESSLRQRNTAAECEGFLKNVLLENELPGDIPLKAREFKIPYQEDRQSFVVSVKGEESRAVRQAIDEVLNDEANDYILAVDENTFVLLLSLKAYDEKEIKGMPERLFEHLDKAFEAEVHVGVGLPVNTLKDVAKSYREATLALIVGRIFEDEKNIMRYNRLGLGRLIYQLPPTMCQMFLSEVFAPNTYETLDDETLLTIQKFFENNLNGSETSRQLFVHRNTLVYRLDKVEKITGLDLRNFDDAVLFKLASMVRKYLESLQGSLTDNRN